MKYLLLLFMIPFMIGCTKPEKKLSDKCTTVAEAILTYFEFESNNLDSLMIEDTNTTPFVRRQFVITEDISPCYTKEMMEYIGFKQISKEDVFRNGNKTIVSSYTYCEKRYVINIIEMPDKLGVVFETISDYEWNRTLCERPDLPVFSQCN